MSLTDQLERREIGVHIPWVLIRLAQGMGILLIVAISSVMDIALPLKVLYALSAVLLGAAVGHPFASVAGDDRGLYVTRYLKTHFVEWPDVLSVRSAMDKGGINISFRSPVAGLRYAVVIFPNMPVKKAFRALATRFRSRSNVRWCNGCVNGFRPHNAHEFGYSTASHMANNPALRGAYGPCKAYRVRVKCQ